MKDYKFSFVILHYLTIEDTIKCVESIEKNCKKYNYNIVIVDNYSSNNTGEKLKQKYSNKEKITVILNKENLGFAKGNNTGFIYAKQNLDPDFIMLINNDTIIIDDEFCSKVIEEYEKSHFAVLGPKIRLKDGSINPVTIDFPGLEQLYAELKILKTEYTANKWPVLKIFYNLYFNIKCILKKLLINMKIISRENVIHDVNKRYENIVLHGCFIIFSKEYINKFDGLYDETFLYREEEILALRLKNNNMLSVYNPEIVIQHNEDSATNAMNKKIRKKIMFMNKHKIQSTNILINLIKESDETSNYL